MTIKDNMFGYTHDGKEVRLYRMQDGDFSVSVLSLGGIIQSLIFAKRTFLFRTLEHTFFTNRDGRRTGS